MGCIFECTRSESVYQEEYSVLGRDLTCHKHECLFFSKRNFVAIKNWNASAEVKKINFGWNGEAHFDLLILIKFFVVLGLCGEGNLFHHSHTKQWEKTSWPKTNKKEPQFIWMLSAAIWRENLPSSPPWHYCSCKEKDGLKILNFKISCSVTGLSLSEGHGLA